MIWIPFIFACAPTEQLDVVDRSSTVERFDGSDEVIARTLGDGTPEAAGLVAFLNDPATTHGILDHEVPLDRRAANNLIAHRDGRDRVAGTDDDNRFDSLAEVDAVKWVGPASLDRLADYAEYAGYVPGWNDTLGTWDGVTFTVYEAVGTIDFVNAASEDTLDNEVPLDRRAVDSILKARPLETVAQLSALYFVGHSAMELILDGAWNLGDFMYEDESERPADPDACTATVAVTSDSEAEDYTELLDLSTTMDAPWAEVIPLAASGCSDWTDPEDSLTQAIWNASYNWTWTEFPADRKEFGDWTRGGTAYAAMLERSLAAIEDEVADGDWDPTEAPGLYESRGDLVDALLDGVRSDPRRYLERTVYLDMLECSEAGVWLLDTETGRVWSLHQFARC
jgi:hypothetical protein